MFRKLEIIFINSLKDPQNHKDDTCRYIQSLNIVCSKRNIEIIILLEKSNYQ